MTLRQALLEQADHCEALGSLFMGRLLRLLSQRWPQTGKLAQRVNDWPGDIGPYGASLPLRIASGLHALVLNAHAPDLVAAYPPHTVSDATLGRAVTNALNTHEAFLLDWINSPPQTNEVRRSAPLIALSHWLNARYGLPFVISELGASAGLNLMWDRYALHTDHGQLGPQNAPLTLAPDWRGALPKSCPPHVTDRRGVDINPVDSHNPDNALRLLSYLWADQPHRADLTRAAIATQNAPVDRGDAIDWLGDRLTQAPEGHLHLIYHTIAWQYFDDAVADRGTRLIETTGARATENTPLAWFAMEADGDVPGAALTLRLWPGNHRTIIGRADFHGRWVQWDAAEI
jgi:hypothetical protein